MLFMDDVQFLSEVQRSAIMSLPVKQVQQRLQGQVYEIELLDQNRWKVWYKPVWCGEKVQEFTNSVWTISKEKENDPIRFRENNCSHFEGIFESERHKVPLSSEMSVELKTFVADFPCPFFVFLGENDRENQKITRLEPESLVDYHHCGLNLTWREGLNLF